MNEKKLALFIDRIGKLIDVYLELIVYLFSFSKKEGSL